MVLVDVFSFDTIELLLSFSFLNGNESDKSLYGFAPESLFLLLEGIDTIRRTDNIRPSKPAIQKGYAKPPK